MGVSVGGWRGLLARFMTEALELLVAVVLSAAVIVASLKLLGEVELLLEEKGFSKEVFLHLLDYVLLIVLAIDIIRTLITALIRRVLPIRIVVETAMLAILREFISIEIRKPANDFLLTLSAVFAVLLVAWIVIGLYEQGVLQERILRRRDGEGGARGAPST